MTADIVTYPEMNEKIVELLKFHGGAVHLYAATRIEELEAKTARLLEQAQQAEAKMGGLEIKIENREAQLVVEIGRQNELRKAYQCLI